MLFADNIYEINMHNEYIYSAVSLVNPPLLPSVIFSIPLLHESTTPFTYLGIPFLVIVVRISIHSRPWLVINCSPLAA
jgi:hypothetical protein